MLFIKNYSKEANEKFKVKTDRSGDNSSLSIIMPNDAELKLLESSVAGLSGSMRRSVESIGKTTGSLVKDETSATTDMLRDKPVEVACYVKEQKVALVAGTGDNILPISVEIAPEITDDKNQKRYPRDMIVFVVDNAADTKLVCDDRNLACKPIIATIGDYQVIFAMVKWPIWSNLKFPVYMYIEQNSEITGAVQLGSRTENKISKNQIEDVDINIAKDYLEESKRLLKERQEKQQNNNRRGGQNRDNRNNNNNADNKGNGNKFQKNVGFPVMKGGYNNNNGKGNGNNNNRRNRGNR